MDQEHWDDAAWDDDSRLPDDEWFEATPTEPPVEMPASAPAADAQRADAIDAWYEVAAAALQTGLVPERAAVLINQLRGADALYKVLDEEDTHQLKRTLSVASAVLADLHEGEVWLDALGLLAGPGRADKRVQEILERIANTPPSAKPESRLAGAVFNCRKLLSRTSANRLVRAIDAGKTPDELAKIFSEIVPPSALDGVATAENPSVAELFNQAILRPTTTTFSSGFMTLDKALHTRPEFPLGFVRGGQLVLMVAPSGAGKTSTIGTVIIAMTTDAIRQGLRGRIIFVHNEDETEDLFDAVGISPGKAHAHMMQRVTALKTTSRSEFVKFFYREVLWAKRQAIDTGLPITTYMPPAVLVDYYQALTEAGENEVQSTSSSADLLLYGVANCDPVALDMFSGISFQEYTGEAWPAGLEGFGIGVIATAQLLLKGNQKPFDPEKGNWRDYATATPADEPAWEVRPGDYPLAKLDDIRGATKIIQHATTIIGLHRSRPRNNPEVGKDDNGYPTLADTRGYFTILKARYGQRLLTIPMEFNRQRNGGSKAQYIDAAAETAIAAPTLKVTFDEELWKQSGDPIIPPRPRRSRMTDIRYS
jgi:hypothetical protein